MKFLKIIPILVLVLTTLACSVSVNVPTTNTGVTQTYEISEPVLEGVDVNRISIEMGAGTLNITGGATQLVEGTITYNVSTWEPMVRHEAEVITLYQETSGNVGIPDGDIKNEWNLQFGSFPINLHLATGAYEGDLNLSGLAITNLSVSDGASKSTIRFDSLNPVEMEELSYETGASSVDLIGLGNANVKEINFDSGVGSYTLDFSGDLQDDIDVRINSGMSEFTIVIPDNAQARITIDGELNDVDANGTWSINGNTYVCGDSGPLITIDLEMAVGDLNLRQE